MYGISHIVYILLFKINAKQVHLSYIPLVMRAVCVKSYHSEYFTVLAESIFHSCNDEHTQVTQEIAVHKLYTSVMSTINMV
jgi:hypothetical protein